MPFLSSRITPIFFLRVAKPVQEDIFALPFSVQGSTSAKLQSAHLPVLQHTSSALQEITLGFRNNGYYKCFQMLSSLSH